MFFPWLPRSLKRIGRGPPTRPLKWPLKPSALPSHTNNQLTHTIQTSPTFQCLLNTTKRSLKTYWFLRRRSLTKRLPTFSSCKTNSDFPLFLSPSIFVCSFYDNWILEWRERLFWHSKLRLHSTVVSHWAFLQLWVRLLIWVRGRSKLQLNDKLMGTIFVRVITRSQPLPTPINCFFN